MLEYLIMAVEMHCYLPVTGSKIDPSFNFHFWIYSFKLKGYSAFIVINTGIRRSFQFHCNWVPWWPPTPTPTPALYMGIRLVFGDYRSLPPVCLCLATSLQLWPLIKLLHWLFPNGDPPDCPDSWMLGSCLLVGGCPLMTLCVGTLIF